MITGGVSNFGQRGAGTGGEGEVSGHVFDDSAQPGRLERPRRLDRAASREPVAAADDTQRRLIDVRRLYELGDLARGGGRQALRCRNRGRTAALALVRHGQAGWLAAR